MSNLIIFIVTGIVLTITAGLFFGIIITERLYLYGWKQVILTAIISLAIGFSISGLFTIQYIADEEQWNNGYCECGGEYELFDIERGYRNGNTLYYYKCNDCKDVFRSQTEFE